MLLETNVGGYRRRVSNDRDYPASLDFDCRPHRGPILGWTRGYTQCVSHTAAAMQCIVTDCKLSVSSACDWLITFQRLI